MKMKDKITVVAVDDHCLIHAAIRSLLADCTQIELVGEGAAGEEIMPLMHEHHPDVLILDLLMPYYLEGKGEGETRFQPLDVLQQLQQTYPEIAVIILSQYLNSGLIKDATRRGVRGYLLKSDNLSLQLPEAIQQVAQGGLFFSLEVSQQMFQTHHAPGVTLSPRQQEIICAIAREPDLCYEQIAEQFVIAPRTVKGHLNEAYRRLGVSNITACIMRCLQLGIIPLKQQGQGIVIDEL